MINRIRENFTQVDNKVINSKELSLKSKGLYTFLCSKPDSWEFNYNGLSSQLQEGEKAIRSAIKELVDFGVLLRYSKKENNKFIGWGWIINPSEEDLKQYIDPTHNSQNRKYPKQEVPEKGSSLNGKENSNTNLSNTNLSNTKENYASSNIIQENELIFKQFRELYPNKKSKQQAKIIFMKLSGEKKQACVEGAKNYAKECRLKETELTYIKHPTTWLNKGCWDDVYERQKKKPTVVVEEDKGEYLSRERLRELLLANNKKNG